MYNKKNFIYKTLIGSLEMVTLRKHKTRTLFSVLILTLAINACMRTQDSDVERIEKKEKTNKKDKELTTTMIDIISIEQPSEDQLESFMLSAPRGQKREDNKQFILTFDCDKNQELVKKSLSNKNGLCKLSVLPLSSFWIKNEETEYTKLEDNNPIVKELTQKREQEDSFGLKGLAKQPSDAERHLTDFVGWVDENLINRRGLEPAKPRKQGDTVYRINETTLRKLDKVSENKRKISEFFTKNLDEFIPAASTKSQKIWKQKAKKQKPLFAPVDDNAWLVAMINNKLKKEFDLPVSRLRKYLAGQKEKNMLIDAKEVYADGKGKQTTIEEKTIGQVIADYPTDVWDHLPIRFKEFLTQRLFTERVLLGETMGSVRTKQKRMQDIQNQNKAVLAYIQKRLAPDGDLAKKYNSIIDDIKREINTKRGEGSKGEVSNSEVYEYMANLSIWKADRPKNAREIEQLMQDLADLNMLKFVSEQRRDLSASMKKNRLPAFISIMETHKGEISLDTDISRLNGFFGSLRKSQQPRLGEKTLPWVESVEGLLYSLSKQPSGRAGSESPSSIKGAGAGFKLTGDKTNKSTESKELLFCIAKNKRLCDTDENGEVFVLRTQNNTPMMRVRVSEIDLDGLMKK